MLLSLQTYHGQKIMVIVLVLAVLLVRTGSLGACAAWKLTFVKTNALESFVGNSPLSFSPYIRISNTSVLDKSPAIVFVEVLVPLVMVMVLYVVPLL